MTILRGNETRDLEEVQEHITMYTAHGRSTLYNSYTWKALEISPAGIATCRMSALGNPGHHIAHDDIHAAMADFRTPSPAKIKHEETQ